MRLALPSVAGLILLPTAAAQALVDVEWFESIWTSFRSLSTMQQAGLAGGIAAVFGLLLGAAGRLRHIPVNLAFTILAGAGGYLAVIGTSRLLEIFGAGGTWLIFAVFVPVLPLAWNMLTTALFRMWRVFQPAAIDPSASPSKWPWGYWIRYRLPGWLGRLPPTIYTDQLARDMQHRLSRNVLGSEQVALEPGLPHRQEIHLVRGDGELPFIEPAIQVYRLIGAWRHQITPGLNLEMDAIDRYLMSADHLLRAVGQYLAEESTRGYLDANDRKYQQPGEFDPEVKAQLEAFFATYRNRLTRALAADVASGDLVDGYFRRIVDDELGLDTTRYDPPIGHVGWSGSGAMDLAANEVRTMMARAVHRQRLGRVHPFLHLPARRLPQFVLAALCIMFFNPVDPGHPEAPFTAELLSPMAPFVGQSWMTQPLVLLALGAVMLYIIVSEVNRASRFAPIMPGIHRSVGELLGRTRAIVPFLLWDALVQMTPLAELSPNAFFVWSIIAWISAAETLALLVFNRSLLGLSVWFHFRPSATVGRPRAIALNFAQHAAFLALTFFMAGQIYAWFQLGVLLEGNLTWLLLFGQLYFIMALVLLQYGVSRLIQTLWALPGLWSLGPNRLTEIVRRRSLKSERKTGEIYAGGPPMRSRVFLKLDLKDIDAAEKDFKNHGDRDRYLCDLRTIARRNVDAAIDELMENYDHLMRSDPHIGSGLRTVVEQAHAQGAGSNPRAWLRLLFEAEAEKLTGLYSPTQLTDHTLDEDLFLATW